MEVLARLQGAAPFGCMVTEATFTAGCTDSGQGLRRPWELFRHHTGDGDTLVHLLCDQL